MVEELDLYCSTQYGEGRALSIEGGKRRDPVDIFERVGVSQASNINSDDWITDSHAGKFDLCNSPEITPRYNTSKSPSTVVPCGISKG